MTNLEVGDIVMCTVERIAGTVVFVKIDRDGQGSIILSEIAPGRIRNLREYVVPKKRIVCKVLRISGDRIDLSLRRVTQKEKKEILEEYKQEQSYKSILKTVLQNNVEKTIQEIEKTERLYDFLEEAKENSKKLEKIVGKKDSEKILNILKTQKQKTAIIKKEFNLTTTKPNGLKLIKEILKPRKNIETKYLSAGRYILKTEAKDAKTADTELKNMLSEIEKTSKKQGLKFSITEK